MLHSYLKYTLDFGMKMPPRDGNLQEQPGYGYQPGFQQPQQWQQQPWN